MRHVFINKIIKKQSFAEIVCVSPAFVPKSLTQITTTNGIAQSDIVNTSKNAECLPENYYHASKYSEWVSEKFGWWRTKTQ